ncbi:MAG: hypothetical protein A3D31_01780 [Candidatus Fluviicola riflensis]|nr:MAG: hypothetical protein CHH17_13255 [Candidatus Fluviicola riflensis]OGS78729.1 MAG: hypothetical protein A3D31_01780 [Candidatus Fluviicola riflensis]OGS86160.1 MAG: hypothetical protein A2724_01235 [Fluviicola sp. RIFCSPHIGHO2_01_FULL_43_53]OGS87691.1 MAG: hypothetical protein A3E30_16445 [Fluviicola sp. RIFCSPHIGHO2_12_FULL_43_24]
MDFRMMIKNHIDAPLHRHLMLELLREYKRPNDKISELLKRGDLISVRRGLYVLGPKIDLPLPEPFLIANHLRGPSYVSLESALSYWGFIPERTFEVSSVTVKSPKKYKTQVGRFNYQQLLTPYYSFGVRSVQLTPKQTILIASPEKAICDKIVLTSKINLRSIKQTREFLLEDLRMDDDMLKTLDLDIIDSWLDNAPKKNSLKMLINTLQEL